MEKDEIKPWIKTALRTDMDTWKFICPDCKLATWAYAPEVQHYKYCPHCGKVRIEDDAED